MTMLALLLAPLSMVGGHAAMAMPTEASASSSHHEGVGDQSEHCAEMSGQTEDEGRSSPVRDCLVNCAVACSALPSLGSVMADQAMAPAMAQLLPLESRVRGLHPESADPPPRIA
jgi:hypothetical protein